ncbi:hypothetical protein RHGRI_012587 [Rhododendron griersonianum]|uniref:Uncharacterized protein n=1 Tax=Rhododendron griersonianum TaxID=479676 RepID=A0AAV6KR32_9ERIC|nr:hypothetical protein RHGRI_012587 [Rhododendron griersonianum]
MEETIDHLFFDSTYSTWVWANLLRIMGIVNTPAPWSSELALILRNVKGKNLASVMYKLALLVLYITFGLRGTPEVFRGKLKLVRQFYAR